MIKHQTLWATRKTIPRKRLLKSNQPTVNHLSYPLQPHDVQHLVTAWWIWTLTRVWPRASWSVRRSGPTCTISCLTRSAQIDTRCRSVCTLGDGVVDSYLASIYLCAWSRFFCFDGVLKVLKVEKSKAPWLARLMVVHYLDVLYWSIPLKDVAQVSLVRVQTETKYANTTTRRGILSVPEVTTSVRHWRSAATPTIVVTTAIIRVITTIIVVAIVPAWTTPIIAVWTRARVILTSITVRPWAWILFAAAAWSWTVFSASTMWSWCRGSAPFGRMFVSGHRTWHRSALSVTHCGCLMSKAANIS